MTEETSLDSKIAVLAKRVDDQARFTRAVVVICTTAVMGVMFYMLTEIFGTLPQVMITNMLGSMDKLVYMWNATEAGAHAMQTRPAATPVAPTAPVVQPTVPGRAPGPATNAPAPQ